MKVIQETSNPRMLRLRPWLGWGVGAFFASGGLLLIVAGQLHTFSCRRTEPMPAFAETPPFKNGRFLILTTRPYGRDITSSSRLSDYSYSILALRRFD